MDWVQFLLLILAMAGMFHWVRSDIALNRSESASDRRDLLQILREMQSEMKDFHGRLCGIEERNKEKK